MYRANHGQWNTTWGNKDNGPRSARSLDLRGLIDPEAQREFAKVVISGFLEATLNGKREYVAMFRDHRAAGAWLPKTMYTTKFQESGYRELANFSEDVDLTTGSEPGVKITGEHLSTWQEKAVPFRGRGSDTQNHNAAWVGWNNEMAAKPDAKPDAPKVMGPPAAFTVTMPSGLAPVETSSSVTVSLAATDTKPGPRPEEKKKEEESADKSKTPAKKPPVKKPAEPKKKKEQPDKTPIDFSVEVIDAAGHSAKLPISNYGIARKPLEANVYRRRGRDKARFTNNYELVPQTFILPLADFVKTAPEFDPKTLTTVRLLFDKTAAGTVVIEHIGVTTAKK
jgi:hypothetical protein